jgi:hypothetical protein
MEKELISCLYADKVFLLRPFSSHSSSIKLSISISEFWLLMLIEGMSKKG